MGNRRIERSGVDSGKISAMMLAILKGNDKNVHSILLVKNGKLVLEEYFYGYRREKSKQFVVYSGFRVMRFHKVK